MVFLVYSDLNRAKRLNAFSPPGLSDADRVAILGGNAAQLLKIPN